MIRAITYNWCFTATGGPAFMKREVGKEYKGKKCVKIVEHEAGGDGDKWYYDIYYDDESTVRVFNPNEVFSEVDDEPFIEE